MLRDRFATSGCRFAAKIRMQILFSEYTIVEKTSQAIDPLGLMRLASALRDAIFPQFTVLTQHPAHLGLLCAVWHELDATADARAPQRARRFRELEVLCGVGAGRKLTHWGCGQSSTSADRQLCFRPPIARIGVVRTVLWTVELKPAGLVRAFLCKAIIIESHRWHASGLLPTPSSSLATNKGYRLKSMQSSGMRYL